MLVNNKLSLYNETWVKKVNLHAKSGSLQGRPVLYYITLYYSCFKFWPRQKKINIGANHFIVGFYLKNIP